MATIEAVISELETKIARNRNYVETTLENAKLDKRSSLSVAEDAECERRMDEIERDKKALTRARAVKHEEDASDKLLRSDRVSLPRPNRASLSVTSNERTYSRANDPKGNGREFLLDVARSYAFGDRRSSERLDRHMAEERIERPGYLERAAGDATTSSYGVGLVVPQYLTEMYAPATANMRPLANVVARHDLPKDGMTLNLSRITTATSAALQSSQLTGVSSTSIGETDLAINVLTAAGSQNISRQAVERGTGIDDVTVADLFKRVATVVDATLITQASTGIQASAQNVTYTSASPTGAEFWPYIFQAESKLEAALLAQARVSHVVMHPRRWNWLCAQTGSTWPFLGAAGSGVPTQQGALQITNEYGASVRGVLSNGLKVVVDANVPTNTSGTQDEVYVIAAEEVHLWEDPNAPVMIRAEQPNAANLGILLVVYEYFAYTVARYANNPSKITGTGLAAPAGF